VTAGRPPGNPPRGAQSGNGRDNPLSPSRPATAGTTAKVGWPITAQPTCDSLLACGRRGVGCLTGRRAVAIARGLRIPSGGIKYQEDGKEAAG